MQGSAGLHSRSWRGRSAHDRRNRFQPQTGAGTAVFLSGFSPFNYVNDTLEWRIDAKTKKPFATIQRWRITDNESADARGRPKSVGLLVVTRIPPGRSCHVAYIDVAANENPNALAQKAADELAAKFDCEKDSIHFIGNKGRAAELAGRK